MTRPALRAAALASALATLPASAVPETFNVDPQHTFPMYEVVHFGYSIQRGRFEKTSGTIVLDMDAKKGEGEIVVETASASSGVPKLDQHLRGEDFFNSARFPRMTFKANQFTFEGDRLRKVDGELTLLGVTRPLSFDVAFFNCAVNPFFGRPVCGADLVGKIRRSEFGMKYGIPMVSDEVTLRVNVEAMRDR